VNGNPNGYNAAPHFLIGVQAGDGDVTRGEERSGVLVRAVSKLL